MEQHKQGPKVKTEGNTEKQWQSVCLRFFPNRIFNSKLLTPTFCGLFSAFASCLHQAAPGFPAFH